MGDIDDVSIQLTHLIQELASRLGTDTLSNSKKMVEHLQKSIGNHTSFMGTVFKDKQFLCTDNPRAEEFQRVYEEIQSRNVKELDPYVTLLALIKRDAIVMSTLDAKSDKVKESMIPYLPQYQVGDRSPRNKPSVSGSSSRNDLAANLRLASTTTSSPTFKHQLLSDLPKSVLKPGQMQQSTRPPDTPVQPDWLYTRPFLSNDYVLDDPPRRVAHANILGTYPVEAQEQMIIEDILFLLMGVEGVHIVPLPLESRYVPRQFEWDTSMSVTLQEMIQQLVPLLSNYSQVSRFVEEKSHFEYGMVNQALAAAIRRLMKDLKILTCQLEHQQRRGQLRLNGLYYTLQDTIITLESLADLVHDINAGQCVGATVVSLLHSKSRAAVGNQKRLDLLNYLTHAAAKPFFDMLQLWIYRGVVQDRYNEFFIQEKKLDSDSGMMFDEYTNNYWNTRYILLQDRVPVFLESIMDKIFRTGKYLNVVAQCNEEDGLSDFVAKELLYSSDGVYCDQIETAYSKSSLMLLTLLKEKGIRQLFDSVKRFFLLDQGDFLVHFMDAAETEMRRESTSVPIGRLEALLEASVRMSAASVDPNRDRLKVSLLPYDLSSQIMLLSNIANSSEPLTLASMMGSDSKLTALEAFCIDIEVEFPLSLVVTRRSIFRYQILFRHLFYCRHVERLLCSVFVTHQKDKDRSVKDLAVYGLRQKMLIFIQNLSYYMSFEVIEPAWHKFSAQLLTVRNIDEMMEIQAEMLNSCLKDCMLYDSQLLKLLHKIMVVCVTFCNFAQRHVDHTSSGSDYKATVDKFDANFTALLRRLLQEIGQLDKKSGLKVANMLNRLNINNYYIQGSVFSSSNAATVATEAP